MQRCREPLEVLHEAGHQGQIAGPGGAPRSGSHAASIATTTETPTGAGTAQLLLPRR